jgi:hypothetical protein
LKEKGKSIDDIYRDFETEHGEEINAIFRLRYADIVVAQVPALHVTLSPAEREAMIERYGNNIRKRKVNPIDNRIRAISRIIKDTGFSAVFRKAAAEEMALLRAKRVAEKDTRTRIKINQLRDGRILDLVRLIRQYHPMVRGRSSLKDADMYRIICNIYIARKLIEPATEKRFFRVVKNAHANAYNRGDITI